jgi:hypothetical protein
MAELLAADRSTSRRSAPSRTLTVAEIEERGEICSLRSLMTVSRREMMARMSGLNTRGASCLFL